MEVEISLSHAERDELLAIARKSITGAVKEEVWKPGIPSDTKLLAKSGAFVTLKEHSELRGCIGYVEARYPLYKTVADVAVKAALNDPRFEPVSEEELKDIEVEISVLSPLRRIKDYKEIVVGKHGIVIESGYNKGLLLPQVATENNWDVEQFVSYTCMKAGLNRKSYEDPCVNIFVFTAEVFAESEINSKESTVV